MSTSPSNLDVNLAAGSVAEGSPIPAWKHELNERLQATRARRSRRTAEQSSLATLEQFIKGESRASRLAAKVAERYAKAPSYSEMLAAQTRAAAVAAEAAAIAARHACVTAEAMLRGMEAADEEHAATALLVELEGPRPAETAGVTSIGSGSLRQSGDRDQVYEAQYTTENPTEEPMLLPPQPLPVNLLEFPRELVASRKARPRLAEGPLREGLEDAPRLRNFAAPQAENSEAAGIEPAAPEWSSIRLDAKPSMPRDEEQFSSLELPLKTAPLEDRLMAAIFDLALVLLAFVLFVLVFVACTAHPPTGKPAWIAGALTLGGLFLLYQYLFFRFTEGTPGMRYAKIALCTFDDENPTRKAMRRRILFLLLSAAPLGLGFAWAWFDTDRLGWHDRLTRMYQRSYR